MLMGVNETIDVVKKFMFNLVSLIDGGNHLSNRISLVFF